MATDPEFTPAQIEETIAHALVEREFWVIPGLIRLLAAQDATRAQEVLDTIHAGLDLARILNAPAARQEAAE